MRARLHSRLRSSPQAVLHPLRPAALAHFAACALLAATPGPDMALFLQKTPSGGRSTRLRSPRGRAMTGVLAHTFAAPVGLSALIAASSRLPRRAANRRGVLLSCGWLYGRLRHGAAPRPQPRGWPLGELGQDLSDRRSHQHHKSENHPVLRDLPPAVHTDAGDASATPKFFFLGAGFVAIGTSVNGLLILIASGLVAAARAHPRAIRLFDFGVAGLMGAFAARLLIAQGS